MSGLLAHLVGDYIFQSHWMATEKVKRSTAALAHALAYTAAFVFITRSWLPLLVIGGSHFVIDRWRLARYVVWLKNGGPRHAPLRFCPTGYNEDAVPVWLSTWLLIIADNTLHLLINTWALGRWA